eukprot:3542841-Amphidinium_carterae.2
MFAAFVTAFLFTTHKEIEHLQARFSLCSTKILNKKGVETLCRYCADLPRVEQSRAELQLPVLSNCRRGPDALVMSKAKPHIRSARHPRALRHDADSIVEFQLK